MQTGRQEAFSKKIIEGKAQSKKKNRQQQLLGKHWKSFPESKVLWETFTSVQ